MLLVGVGSSSSGGGVKGVIAISQKEIHEVEKQRGGTNETRRFWLAVVVVVVFREV